MKTLLKALFFVSFKFFLWIIIFLLQQNRIDNIIPSLEITEIFFFLVTWFLSRQLPLLFFIFWMLWILCQISISKKLIICYIITRPRGLETVEYLEYDAFSKNMFYTKVGKFWSIYSVKKFVQWSKSFWLVFYWLNTTPNMGSGPKTKSAHLLISTKP